MTPSFLIVHHTASSRDGTSLGDVNNWHRARWPDFISSLGYFVGYHYLITGNGEIEHTRQDDEEGAHTLGGYNQKSIGVCLTGNFELEEPSLFQLNSLRFLLDKLKKEYNIPDKRILYHRQVWPTDCCGRNLIVWLNAYKQVSFLQGQLAKLKRLLGLI